MKKCIKYLAFILVLLIGTLLIGCGKESTIEETTPIRKYDGSEVTVVFCHALKPHLSDVIDRYIVEFNKLYPNIHIDSQKSSTDMDLYERLRRDTIRPNIVYSYPEYATIYNNSEFASFDDLIKSSKSDGKGGIIGLTQDQIDDFVPGFYEEGTAYDNELMYTMPFCKSTEVLYYNKTFFEANKLSVPTTWDEMEALCAKIKEIDPNCIPLGYDSSSNWFITMCEQYKASGVKTAYTSVSKEHCLFDTDVNKEFVKKFKSWFDKGYVVTHEIYAGYTSGLFVNTNQGELKCYMNIDSSTRANNNCPTKVNNRYPFEVGIATIPQVNPSSPKVIFQGPSIFIYKKSNPQEIAATWLFVKYLTTSTEFQAEYALASGGGYVPALKSVMENESFANMLNQADGGDNVSALSTKICMEQADAYFFIPAFGGCEYVKKQVGYIIDRALVSDGSDATIQEIFKAVIEDCRHNISWQ